MWVVDKVNVQKYGLAKFEGNVDYLANAIHEGAKPIATYYLYNLVDRLVVDPT